MNERNITRSQFLRQGSCLAAMGALGAYGAESRAVDTESNAPQRAVALRPGELLCLVCSFGDEAGPKGSKLMDVISAIRKNPDVPITLPCNAGIGFEFQKPGAGDSIADNAEFNNLRDLTVLQRMDMTPGETLPARILIHRLLKLVRTVEGICGFGVVTSDAWKGCPKATSGCYERGCEKVASALIPARSEEEMASEKKASTVAIRTADVVRVRPHILLCSICQYGSGTRPPYKEDNLPELIEMILTDRPDLSITLVAGADWMMCAPCPHRDPRTGWCAIGHVKSGGLYGELKDLNVLQRLGLTFGTTMKARDLYKLIFDKISTVVGVCALDANGKSSHSVWRDGCGNTPEESQKGFQKGKEALSAKML